ncbi:porin [Rhodomicrobium vannielii ATCC 17100]|uniref:Porin n=1 Tax=Rhodomicrobium vannielii (strain ATCC 17100 / DSM 162 / LMG 4299 / NCIMB 10020 / ATH 3.1.1) TaxID=648757 RepID=E3I2A8_RHOVT|nr:outer membrane beta-barrel protein [Rhodomicrobium vannielii]ADP72495.1 porin [Rhodomicrobium vannielii ATCC 17100]
MKLLSGIAGLTLASVVAIASANSADLYRGQAGGYKDGPIVAPVATWTGFYAGLNVGYGWNDDADADGIIGGGQIGYNWQGAFGTSPLVLGVETDIQGSDIKNDNDDKLNYFGTVRGRLGYALGNSLVYATGGFAYGEFDGADKTSTGYTVGGGVEHKFTPNLSVKAEYLYTDLGDNDSDNADFNTVRVGLNYHFGATGYEPLK